MKHVVVQGGLPGLVTRLRGQGIDVRVLDSESKNRDLVEAMRGSGYAFILCRNANGAPSNDEAVAQLIESLGVATSHDVPVCAVVQDVDHDLFTNVILRHACLDMTIEETAIEDIDLNTVERFLAPAEPIRDGAFPIGSLVRMPSTPAEYEAKRSLSLVSPKMRLFIAELRMAVDAMNRDDRKAFPPDRRPPWDVSNSQEFAAARIDGVWRLKDRAKFPRRPNLRDVLCLHATPEARKLLHPDRGPWAGPLPGRLLIEGESGTGKSLVARLVHEMLTKPAGPGENRAPFERISSGGMQVRNFDHAMFGAAPDVWTEIGAVAGQLTRAAYGVAFFDEIGDLPIETQTRLLTFLDDLLLKPEGIQPFFGFMHVIAATNRDLEHLTSTGEFRHDLHARFVHRVKLPPLRERGPGELRKLIDFTAQNPDYNPVRHNEDREVTHVAPDAMTTLIQHDYRAGNFRELEEVVYGALLAARTERSPAIEDRHVAHVRTRTGFRPEADRSIVRVAVDDPLELAGARRIRVENLEELRRLASRRELPILIGKANQTHVVMDGEIAFYSIDDNQE